MTLPYLKHIIHVGTRGVSKFITSVEIGINDDCNNGVAEFYVTYNSLMRSEGNKHYYQHSCGALSEDSDAFKAMPKKTQDFLRPFMDLHLSDQLGRPLYCVENSFYHLENSSKETVMRYMRISGFEYDNLKARVYDKTTLFAWLKIYNIFERWRDEANAAIAKLEELTGNKFDYTITKNYQNLEEMDENFETYKEQILYTMEPKKAAKMREQIRKDAFDKVVRDKTQYLIDKKLEYILECNVYKVIAKAVWSMRRFLESPEKVLESFILYTFNRTIVFNWGVTQAYKKANYSDVRYVIKKLNTMEYFKTQNIHILALEPPFTLDNKKEQLAVEWLRNNNLLTRK